MSTSRLVDEDLTSNAGDGVASPTESGDAHTAHIVSAATLIATCTGLLVLTWLTVAVSWYDLGPMNVVFALGVAATKATVVALYFMHLRWDRPFNRIVIIAALFFVVFFISLCVMDTQEYRFDVDPGDAPLVRERLEAGQNAQTL